MVTVTVRVNSVLELRGQTQLSDAAATDATTTSTAATATATTRIAANGTAVAATGATAGAV